MRCDLSSRRSGREILKMLSKSQDSRFGLWRLHYKSLMSRGPKISIRRLSIYVIQFSRYRIRANRRGVVARVLIRGVSGFSGGPSAISVTLHSKIEATIKRFPGISGLEEPAFYELASLQRLGGASFRCFPGLRLG